MNENKRLIYADDLLNEMAAGCIPIHEKGISGILGDESCIKDYIDNAPTVEAEPISHGRNITTEHPADEFICSECGIYLTDFLRIEDTACYEYTMKYCSNCGAKMDLED